MNDVAVTTLRSQCSPIQSPAHWHTPSMHSPCPEQGGASPRWQVERGSAGGKTQEVGDVGAANCGMVKRSSSSGGSTRMGAA
jgi:hypothetical protein